MSEGDQRRTHSLRVVETPGAVDILWGVKIPMRDSVRLDATLYRPHGQTNPLPVILSMTPYFSDTFHGRAIYFARNGYVSALVDVRGRGNSEGEFEPMANEGRDGHDVVEWLAKQPWCDGKVAMWGGSYAGFDQWATAKSFPPHLKSIIPIASVYPALDFPFDHNISYPYVIQWLVCNNGIRGTQLFFDSEFWISKFSELYRRHLPFQELDRVVGSTNTVFQKWIAHLTPDDYWSAMVPSPDDYKRIDIPILTIAGYYDRTTMSALTYYRKHTQHATAEARENHFLVMGPWDHLSIAYSTVAPAREVGGLTSGEAGALDLSRLYKEWYDWTLKQGPRPEFLKKGVAYYVVEAEVWKYADNLESISNQGLRFYLSSRNGQANETFGPGKLTTREPEREAPDRYVYDPLDTRPAELHQKEIKNFMTDQTDALNLYGNGVVYHSEPFDIDTEVAGQLKFVAWIAMDVPDTDFHVEVDEIKTDGTSIMLTEDYMRARYRDSLTEEKLVNIGEVNSYEFKDFTFFSRRISKGSRLRLVLKCPNSIHLEKNYNSGKAVALETGQDARTAHVEVYHDEQHRSFLEMPVVA